MKYIILARKNSRFLLQQPKWKEKEDEKYIKERQQVLSFCTSDIEFIYDIITVHAEETTTEND